MKLLYQSGRLMFPPESRVITQMVSQNSLLKIPQGHLNFSALGLGSKNEITFLVLLCLFLTTQLFTRDMKYSPYLSKISLRYTKQTEKLL